MKRKIIIFVLVHFLFLLIPYSDTPVEYFNILGNATGTLRGESIRSDMAQDFYGVQAIVNGWNPYVDIGVGLARIGVDWDVSHPSTHPPTAFLLTAPVAFFPWSIASALWGWLMLFAMYASLKIYNLPWWSFIFILFWSPAALSFAQLTPLWLLGVAFAYKNQDKPFRAGLWIGFASLTKFFPALLLIPFLIRRKQNVVAGFALVWAVALGIIVALNPLTLLRYIEANRAESSIVISRSDNGGLFPSVFGSYGLYVGSLGVVLVLAFLIYIVYKCWKDWRLYEYLSVALLPIAWTYSLLPLLPGLLRSKSVFAKIALLVSIIFQPFNERHVLAIPLVMILYGLSLLTETWSSPSHIFQVLISKFRQYSMR